MDDRIRELMKELGNAINESLSDSESIAEAIGNIKRAGFDVFMMLEATIGFVPCEETDDDGEEAPTRKPPTSSESLEPRQPIRGGVIHWTSQDQKFLRALNITDEETI